MADEIFSGFRPPLECLVEASVTSKGVALYTRISWSTCLVVLTACSRSFPPPAGDRIRVICQHDLEFILSKVRSCWRLDYAVSALSHCSWLGGDYYLIVNDLAYYADIRNSHSQTRPPIRFLTRPLFFKWNGC